MTVIEQHVLDHHFEEDLPRLVQEGPIVRALEA